MNLFAQIFKVDTAKQEVYGRIAEEAPDSAKEIMDYAKSLPNFKAWSEGFHEATGGLSKGNVRAMHGKVAAGVLKDISFLDEEKAIDVKAHIVDGAEWEKVEKGVYTGFSIGGTYGDRWKDGDLTRYEARPSEVSLVDNPCLKSARFTLVKADGSIEKREFSQEARDKAADTGAAMPDGSFPIKTTGDLKNAIKALGRAKDTAAAKKHIIARAKALNATNLLPEDWTGSTKQKAELAQDLKKYAGQEIWDVASALSALQTIYYLYVSEMSEPEGEGGQTADLKAVIDRLKSFISSEIMETTDLSMAEKSGALRKRGARNSGTDLERIQGIHDHAVGLGADCGTNKGEVDTMDKAMEERMAKLETDLGTLQKDFGEAKEELAKVKGENEALAKENADLKKQPEPGGPIVKGVVISKEADNGQKEVQEPEPVKKADGTIDQEETAVSLIKHAQGKPFILAPAKFGQ